MTDGTDNHIVLWNVRDLGLTGSKMNFTCENVGLIANKNVIAGDKSALTPGGMRLGSPALTSRGLLENDFDEVADFLDRAAKLSLKVQE